MESDFLLGLLSGVGLVGLVLALFPQLVARRRR